MMKSVRPDKFRILVVGDVISTSWKVAGGSDQEQVSSKDFMETQHFGGAANIARFAAELGAMVGFLPLSKFDESARLHQMAHFHLLLPQYDVIVFSEYGDCDLNDLNDMVASATRLHKRVLVDLDQDGLALSTGASLTVSNVDVLRRMIGGWRSEQELSTMLTTLLAVFNCEGFLVNRNDSGISLYLPEGAIHFPCMARCDRYFLLAIIAVALQKGISIPEAVTYASDHVNQANALSQEDMRSLEETSF